MGSGGILDWKEAFAALAMTYTVVLERDETGAWVADVPAVPGCHTYGRSLNEALSRTREALSLWVEEADRAELEPDIRIDPELRTAAREGVRARTKAEVAQAAARKAIGEAARRLTAAGLSRRDVATLLGVSHQRIQQLLDAR